MGQALKRVNPRQHHERQTSITRHLNPVPYYAEYFGHKLHLDQNEKLIRYGVTEVIAVDGYSSFITATSVSKNFFGDHFLGNQAEISNQAS